MRHKALEDRKSNHVGVQRFTLVRREELCVEAERRENTGIVVELPNLRSHKMELRKGTILTSLDS
jgi:hypothetical protein